ncbi:MAG: MlaE family ABC transporter permease [Nitrospinota bacterium]
MNTLGLYIYGMLEEMGCLLLLFIESLRWALRPPYRLRNVFGQMEFVGVRSSAVVVLTGAFTGMVLAFQSYHAFRKFNAESFVGPVVALSMGRELGPVLTGIMVTARAGSAMAAELGTMRVTEQIDALDTLATNPVHYLVVPRLVAGVVMVPLLTVVTDFLGVLGGYAVGVGLLGINPHVYVEKTLDLVEMTDITDGLVKAAFFGLILALVGCYKGFYTTGGAEGVGRATTQAVVTAALLIIVADYILTALMFR